MGHAFGWDRVERAGRGFAGAYALLYLLPFPLGALPGTEALAAAYEAPWRALVPRVAGVLGLGPLGRLERGDTLYGWVELLCFAALAALGGLVWAARPAGGALPRWVRAYVRAAVAVGLFGYGMVKLVPQQFPFPPLERLLVPFGQSSPRGLLWTFMGYSRAYSAFGGALEVLAGLLLCSRRTATLGALLGMGVMANVLMLNLCYDVQVKVYSAHLMLLCAGLAAGDARRLLEVFLLNRPAAPAELGPPAPRWRAGLKWLAVLAVLGRDAQEARAFVHQRGFDAPRPALYGLYEVESFALNGAERPPLATDAERWSKVIVDVADGAHLALLAKTMDGTVLRFQLEEGPGAEQVTLSRAGAPPATLQLSRPEPGRLLLQGPLGAGALSVRLRRVGEDELPLLARRFRLVTE